MPHHDTKANALMVTSSFDRSIGGTASNSVITQPYNNFRVQTLGGNIIQGAINRIRVGEVFFPYQIPTLVQGKNNDIACVVYKVTAGTGAAPSVVVEYLDQFFMPPGYYTATEMATELEVQIDGVFSAIAGAPTGVIAADVGPDGAICLQNTTTFSATPGAVNWLFSFLPYVFANSTSQTKFLELPNFQWTLGFRQLYASYPPRSPTWSTPANFSYPLSPTLVPKGWPQTGGTGGTSLPIFAPGYAPNALLGSTYSGRYTDYIDICSPALCQAQYVRDGNTNQGTVRRDQICRLYIADEISVFTADSVGTRPFIIHRQFKNAKVMKWTAERSIDAIDILLFDMYGQPVPIPQLPPFVAVTGTDYVVNNGPGDFAITFLVEEQESELMSNVSNIGYRM